MWVRLNLALHSDDFLATISYLYVPSYETSVDRVGLVL